MKLWILTILLGLGYALPQVYGVLQPASFGERLRQFPRSQVWGMVLMSLGTIWFLYNLSQNHISDFASLRPALFIGFAVIGFGTCAFVRDFLAVRGFAVMVLLLAKLVLDTARWVDSPWRLVLAVWAYIWVLLAVWFTISPWRLRDWIQWLTANERRIRVASALRLAFGLFLIVLAVTAFRRAELASP